MVIKFLILGCISFLHWQLPAEQAFETVNYLLRRKEAGFLCCDANRPKVPAELRQSLVCDSYEMLLILRPGEV
jgi:hypothetical protein